MVRATKRTLLTGSAMSAAWRNRRTRFVISTSGGVQDRPRSLVGKKPANAKLPVMRRWVTINDKSERTIAAN